MKNFTKAGAKFAAAVAMSVMALGYTTSVWADESAGITKEETVFKNIKGTQTEILNDILYRSNKADEVKATALDIHDVEKKNFINSDQDGLFIGCQAMAYKNAEGIGVHVKDAQADFKIKGNFVVQASGVISEKEEEASGVIGGTEENVSMKAVGFYGENGSSQIEANSVSYTVKNEYPSGIHTGMLDEEMQGIYANNYNINILAKNDIEISYWIPETLSGTMTAQGMILSNGSKASLQAGGKIQIGDGSGFTRNNNLTAINTSNSNLAAINASESTLDIKAKNGIEIVAVNKDAVGAIQNENVYAIYAEKSAIALDGGESGISIYGNVNVLDNSTLKLSGETSIGKKFMRTAMPGSNLTVENSTLIVDGLVTTSGTTTLNKAKIYMYDANNAEAGFHALAINNLNIVGRNELFLRADSSMEVNNSPLNSDVIGISGNIITDNMTEEDKLYVNVFDKGMKNGYGMGTDGPKDLTANPITVLYSRDSTIDFTSLIDSKKINVNVMHYDNGIWNYAYSMSMDAEQDGKSLVIKNVKVKAQASDSQRSLHSANKAAAALAVDVLGGDSALSEHLREVREHKDNENVWAKYHGGKLKSDGVQLKYNGVELGYDAYVGNDWTFGVSGQQVRGNTQLDSGSDKAKTNVGTVYGAWHGGSSYLNLEAKTGRVSSESKTFGGTVLQKISGEFSAPAYSVSAEYGSTHELPAAWYLEPAVRLSYVHMGAADYSVRTQDTLARVANDSLDSFILRGGAKLGRRLGAKGSFYVKAAAVYDFGGDLATTVSADGRPAHYEDSLGGWGVEYGAGLEYKLGKAANISLDFERRSGGELKRDWGVNIGVNYSF
ncbi:autotransporter outer membrane beta-barrel domain-containing protein [Phascolarctobacterium sp.]|uniref:autotransporter family protein n=1 Tax=Phascolarctobacterium sp. TaxID=2049039 RepID=UPI0025F6D2AD|nr:autotransporter outer membrane beta-barrel domain-containing protein [Phascolarctobacterium sp.]